MLSLLDDSVYVTRRDGNCLPTIKIDIVDDIDHIPAILADVLLDGDIVVTQGAGSVSSIAHKLSKLNISEL